MFSYGPPHMAQQKQDDQLEPTYSWSVRIRDIALRTNQNRRTIGRSGDRGSGISMLAARHEDDDMVLSHWLSSITKTTHVLLYISMCVCVCVCARVQNNYLFELEWWKLHPYLFSCFFSLLKINHDTLQVIWFLVGPSTFHSYLVNIWSFIRTDALSKLWMNFTYSLTHTHTHTYMYIYIYIYIYRAWLFYYQRCRRFDFHH